MRPTTCGRGQVRDLTAAHPPTHCQPRQPHPPEPSNPPPPHTLVHPILNITTPPTHTHTHVPTTTATSTPTGSGPRLLASGVAVLRAAVAADAAIETAEQKANVEEAHRLRAEFADAASSLRREVSTRFHPLPPHLRLRCYGICSNVQTRVVNSFAPWRLSPPLAFLLSLAAEFSALLFTFSYVCTCTCTCTRLVNCQHLVH
jgi:hypothetical protein